MITRRVPLRRSAPLQRGLPPKRRVPVRPKRFQPRRGPARSPEYLAWIRTLPCLVCSRVSGGATVIEAAHTNALGRKGMGQKTTDFSAIPLCAAHHREYPDSYHRLGEPCFVRQHRIDVHQVATELKHLFDATLCRACQRSDDDPVNQLPKCGGPRRRRNDRVALEIGLTRGTPPKTNPRQKDMG